MRCSATVVLPEPAAPRITTKPADGRVISVELLGVDQPGDVGQVLVGAPRGPSCGRCRGGAAARRRRRARAARRPSPPASRGGSRAMRRQPPSGASASAGRCPRARRRAAERAVADRDRAPRDDLAAALARRRSPPRRPRPGGSGRRAARPARGASRRSRRRRRGACALPSRISCSPLSSRSRRWREVGRLEVDARLRARGAELLEQRRVAVPLLEQRRLVLGLGAVAQRLFQALELLDERALRRRRGRAGPGRVERPPDALQEIELLGDDRRWGRRGHGRSGLAGRVIVKEPVHPPCVGPSRPIRWASAPSEFGHLDRGS